MKNNELNLSEINSLLKKIINVRQDYEHKKEEQRFSLFTALHKERDEVNLHSRVISYLLSPNSGHGQGNSYAKIFIEEILKKDLEQDFSLEGYKVIPNEYNKSEYKEIDILLINENKKQAIIIENKIDAKDSNDENNKEKYRGQLERYYTTIKKGEDKDGRPTEYKCDNVFIYYLTLYKQPTKESIGYLENVKIIYYGNEIRDWLEKSLKVESNDNYLKMFILQYLNLINKMTMNDISIDMRIELKNAVANNWKELMHLVNNFGTTAILVER